MGLRINHNLASLNASLNLGKANSLLSKSLQRLSTGLRINTAADGPADLIISEKFRAQIRSLSQATENTQTAISMLSTAEGALTEVNSLLVKMKGLALKAAQTGTADSDEIAASQSEIDAALQSINSISRNTSFGTKFLLDGSLDISSTEVDTDKIRVDMEKANFAGDVKRLTINVNSASVQAENKVLLNSAGTLTVGQTLKITGTRGSSTIQFAAGAAGADIAKEINDQTTQTNVTAAYDSINKEVVFKSVEYGATEFVTVEDVDGTNDILKGQLGEKLTAATLEYGGQFKLTAKDAGTSGNNISFQFNETTTSTTGAISITQDASTGGTNIILALEDEGKSFYGSTGFDEFNKNIDTTLSEIKSLIESNAVLNDLVEFSLESGASLTDKVSIDSSFTSAAQKLAGGASGEAAVAASVTLTGTSTALGATGNANNITFTAKTAGASGNDINILFSETGSALSTLAINARGSAFSQNAGYFSANNGTSQIFMKSNGTLYINASASFQQIKESIEADAVASQLISVEFSGASNSNFVVAGDHTKVQSLEGGEGLTGGREAQAFIKFAATEDLGLLVKAKDTGAASNGIEFVIRQRGGLDENTVDVFGNKIIVNMNDNATTGSATVFENLLQTDGDDLAIVANITGSYASKFNFKIENDESLGDNAAISFDSLNNVITITLDADETSVGKLQTAIAGSTAVLDSETGLTVGDLFKLSTSDNAALTAGEIVSSVLNSAFTGFGTTLIGGYFSGAGTIGSNAQSDTSAYGIVQLIRQNATANALVDVDFFVRSGTSVGVSTVAGLVDDNLSAMVSGNTIGIQDATHAFGDYNFTLTGGYDGEVSTNSVTQKGTDGVVEVNGVATAAQNLAFTFDNGDVRGTITLNESFNASGNSSTFELSSKGAFFQIGQKAQLSYQTGIALGNISSNALGEGLYFNSSFDTSIAESSSNTRRVVGTLADISSGSNFDLAKDATTAVNIIDAAIQDVSILRGRVGAFISNTLDSNINSLGVAFENLTAAESRIRDIDFAAETANFTRAQILVQAGTSIAAQANVATQAALQLLG